MTQIRYTLIWLPTSHILDSVYRYVYPSQKNPSWATACTCYIWFPPFLEREENRQENILLAFSSHIFRKLYGFQTHTYLTHYIVAYIWVKKSHLSYCLHMLFMISSISWKRRKSTRKYLIGIRDKPNTQTQMASNLTYTWQRT